MNTSPERSRSVRTSSAEATRELAARLGRRMRGGEVVTLSGPLGAGKTTFTKGLAEGLGIDPRDVTSPTFLLLHELSGRLALVHIDAYRVGEAEELAEIGAGDAFREDSVVVIEWAERAPGLAPEDRLEIGIDYEDSGEEDRRLRLTATGPVHARLLSAADGEIGA